MITIRTTTMILALGGLLAAAVPAQQEKEIRSLLAKYLRADDKSRTDILKNDIKSLGDPAVPIIQAAMDQLIPCYRKGNKALRRAKRRKQEIKQLDKQEVAGWVIALISRKAEPAPELSKPEAQDGLNAMLRPLSIAREVILRPEIVKFFKDVRASGVSFSGQYLPLKKRYGRAAMAVLLQMAMAGNNSHALVALRDVADKNEPAVIRLLNKLAADEYQSKSYRLEAAITLACLGSNNAIEPFMEELTKQTKKEKLRLQERAWRMLASIWHQLGQYKKAVEFNTKYVDVVRKLVAEKKRYDWNLGLALRGRACSRAMAGMVEEAIADLKEALKLKAVGSESLERDPELNSLHKHPEWKKILDAAPRRFKPSYK